MNSRDSRASRLHTLALLLYPNDLRHRYGPEIRDLLETSPTPIRDLANVARTGAWERVTAKLSRLAGCRPPSRRTQQWIATSVATVAAEAAPLAGFGTVPWAAAVTGMAAGFLLTRRCADLRLALLVSSGVLFIYLMPHLWESVSGENGRTPELIATLAFSLTLAVAALLLRYRPRRGMAAAASTVAILTLPPLATTLLAALTNLSHPWQSYWLTIFSRAPLEVDHALVHYPALYTCCAFLLLASAVTTRRTQATRPSVSVAAG